MEERLERLAESVEGHPARFVPELMRGELIDAEHRARYWWAAALARDKHVLDAACGTGYGSNILAGAGAASVTAVDIAEHVVVEARKTALPGVTFEPADLAQLPFDDGSFDLVVCFEAIEHVESPDTVLDGFARVLSEDGVLAISSPNRGEYVEGNPHHRHEYVPDELEAALAARWRNVRLLRQHDWATSGILPDELFAREGGGAVDDAIVGNIAPLESGRELYTIAVASNGALPRTGPAIVLGDLFEVRRWIDHVATLERQMEAFDAHIRDLEAERLTLWAERDALQSERDALQAKRDALQAEHEALQGERDVLQAEHDEALTQRAIVENELTAIRLTKTFRYTNRARAFYGSARGRLKPRGRD